MSELVATLRALQRIGSPHSSGCRPAGPAASPPQYGCPYGSLSTELARQADAPDPPAAALLHLQLEWVEEQFRALDRTDSRDLAVQLLVCWQGGAVLTSALGQSELMAEQARRIQDWIAGLDT